VIGGLGGLAAGAAKWFAPNPNAALSDRRLKDQIELVGHDASTGLNLYRFAYVFDPARRFVGVMADEVRTLFPAAVQRGADGFDRVNYGLLGLEMVRA